MTQSLCGSHGCRIDSPADQLNRDCFCKTLNRDHLDAILQGDTLNKNILQSHPQLFSNTAVFISKAQLSAIQNVVHAVERVVHLPLFQQRIFTGVADISKKLDATSGVFMGYDFHLSEAGPQVIEINTNAGGAFLNAALVRAQTACCQEIDSHLTSAKKAVDEQIVAMFLREWQLARGDVPLARIAIVDEQPQEQFLYPEFQMAQRLFVKNGIEAVIVDPAELKLENGELWLDGHKIDLVYNRLTDFSLSNKGSRDLRLAYLTGSVVVTPNPYHHRLYADKRNLILLSDDSALRDFGASDGDISILQSAIPKTVAVNQNNAELLWQSRKELFFKPAAGFGGRAAYRGDKLTKRVWQDILSGDYVAQKKVPPSERGVLLDEQKVALKMDIRAYVYGGEIQLLAARLYQGQTTNFRTQGGGFAPVFITSPSEND